MAEKWFETAKDAIEYVFSDYWVEPTHVSDEQEAWKFNVEVQPLDWSESGLVHFENRKPRGPGRPRFDPAAPTVRTTIRLTQAQVTKAEALGGGNVAEGVRAAIDKA